MAKRLDKSREHGTIHPPHIGAFFEQDGYLFDHEGAFLANHPDQKKLPDKKATAEKQATASQPPAGDGDDGQRGAENELNLEAWLRGEEEYDFGLVQKVVKARYHKLATRKDVLVEFLVTDNNGPRLVPIDQLAPALAQAIKPAA